MRLDCTECAFHRSYSQDLVRYVWQLEGEARSARRWLVTLTLFNVLNGVLLLVKPW